VAFRERYMRKEAVKPGGKLKGRYGVYLGNRKVGTIIRTRMWFPVVKGKADFGLFCNSPEQAAALVIKLDAAQDGKPCPECNGTKTILVHDEFYGATTDDYHSEPCPICERAN
jgi:hypothetical protein